jgi:triosephosphate isomerase
VLDADIAILYGVSVNATELFSMPDIDGLLVGSASLNPADFMAICQADS